MEIDIEYKVYMLDRQNILFNKMYILGHDHKLGIGKVSMMNMLYCLFWNKNDTCREI